MLNMTPEEAYLQAFNSGKRLPKLEPIIQQKACWAYLYAKYVINGRWPEAEPIIQKDAEWAYHYTRDVLKDRWPEAEPVIQQDAEWAYYYAIYVIKGRWLEAEKCIAQGDFELCYISLFFSEPVITKDQYSDFEWERAGAEGFFTPRRLFEIERKESLIDMMIDNQDMLQYQL